MEKNLLFGITIGGAAIAALYYISKKNKKTYVEVNKEAVEENGAGEIKEAPTTREVIEEKVKEAGKRMANWILEHKDYIEAAGATVGFVTSLFSLRNAVSPKKPKGLVSMNKKEYDRYIAEMFYRARKDMLNDFFDDMFERGGQTITNSDGVRQLIITTNQIGESA